MSRPIRISIRSWAAASVVTLLSLLASCADIRIVSDYDEETAKSLTSLEQTTDDFIVALEKVVGTPDGAFDKHAAFYDGVDRDLRRLEFRVNAIPKNNHTQMLVKDIRAAILGAGACDETGTSLRDLHCLPASRARGPSKTALELSRRNVNQTISAALSLELAKKQGLEHNDQ